MPRGGNFAGWHNDQVDKMLEDMRVDFDDDHRDATFREFCTIFQEEQPMTPLVHGIVGVLLNKRIEGVNIQKRGMRPEEFWVKPENVLHK